jgi:capsular polysaccharide biosynthesis protein
MRRHLFLVLSILTVLSILVVFALWHETCPQYKALAEVRVRPNIPYLVFKTDDNVMIPSYDLYLNTQVSIIESMTVLQRVLDKQEVRNTKWYKEPEHSFISKLLKASYISPLERLRSNLSVTPRKNTEIIDVSFLAPNAQDAKVILNVVLDSYIQYFKEDSDAADNMIYRQLTEQYTSLKNEINVCEYSVNELYNSMGTKSPHELISNKRIRLEQLKADLAENAQKIAILERILKEPNNVANYEPGSDKTKLEYQIAQVQVGEEFLTSEISSQQKELSDLLKKAEMIESENIQIKYKRDLFDAVRKRLDQKNIERNAPGSVEILMRAFVSSQPHSGHRILFLAVTLFIWLFLCSLIILISRKHSGKAGEKQS